MTTLQGLVQKSGTCIVQIQQDQQEQQKRVVDYLYQDCQALAIRGYHGWIVHKSRTQQNIDLLLQRYPNELRMSRGCILWDNTKDNTNDCEKDTWSRYFCCNSQDKTLKLFRGHVPLSFRHVLKRPLDVPT